MQKDLVISCIGNSARSFWLNLTFLNVLSLIFTFGRLFIGMIEVKQDTYIELRKICQIVQSISVFTAFPRLSKPEKYK